LASVYPSHKWDASRFSKVPSRYWESKQNVTDLISTLQSRLYINDTHQWNSISNCDLTTFKVGSVLRRYGGLKNFLKKFIPGFSDTGKDSRFAQLKSQNTLYRMLKLLLPGWEVEFNRRQEDLRFESTMSMMELDIFFPFLSIAFEYQGEHHYKSNKILGESSVTQKRDREKKKICEEKGITLIEIPFWWDRKKDSLIATIQNYRPDLVLS